MPRVPRTRNTLLASSSVASRPIARPSRLLRKSLAWIRTLATDMYARFPRAIPSCPMELGLRKGGFHSQSIWMASPTCWLRSWAIPAGGIRDSPLTVQSVVSATSSPPDTSARIHGVWLPPSKLSNACVNGVCPESRAAL